MHIAERKGRPWAKEGSAGHMERARKRATTPDEKGFCCMSLRSPTGESEKKIQAVGR